jgi:oligoribonuclease
MATNQGSEGRLIWIDLEMTGLDTGADSILEIATIVTDSQLNVLAEGPELAIAHSLASLQAMDEWNRTQHRKSGLWQRVLDSEVGIAEAEALEKHFHYRNLDVSTIKELARRWAPPVLAGLRKHAAHTALSDVRDSIAELAYYRQHMGTLAGLDGTKPPV